MERDAENYMIGGIKTDFNSHAHVERDDENIARINLEGISTHTLTWSVTLIIC